MRPREDRVLLGAGYVDVNYNFYGIGPDSGTAGISVSLNQTGYRGLAELLVRVLSSLTTSTSASVRSRWSP